MRLIQKKTQRGQGMVEYIIIVVVMAIASIVVYTQFGDVLRSQVSDATASLAGESKQSKSDRDAAVAKAGNNVKKTLQNY